MLPTPPMTDSPSAERSEQSQPHGVSSERPKSPTMRRNFDRRLLEDHDANQRAVLRALRVITLVVALTQLWLTRRWFWPDGVSYLDVADGFVRGDWMGAVNGYWSPLYALLLSLPLAIFKPGPDWEFLLVHLMHLLIFVVTWGCFEFLLRELVAYRRLLAGARTRPRRILGDEIVLIAAAYTLFVWASLRLITLWRPTPDLCVSAVVYLAAGLLLRIRCGDGRHRTFAALGIVLGVAYLFKAVMFVLSPIFFLTAVAAHGRRRGVVSRVMIAIVVFTSLAGTFLIPLSVKLGKPTFGESGLLNYAWYVNRVPYGFHWQGEQEENGRPKHPTRIVREDPRVYEFGTPFQATYACWYDPSYWFDGVKPRFTLSEQVSQFICVSKDYACLLLQDEIAFVTGVLALLLIGSWGLRGSSFQRLRVWIAALVPQFPLLVPAAAGLGVYSVIHMEARLIGPFLVLGLIGLVFSVPPGAYGRSSLRRAALAVVASTWLSLATGLVSDLTDDTDHYCHVRIAHGLKALGLNPGDPVGHIGNSAKAYWARLAGLRIVAEVRPSDAAEFWMVDPEAQQEVLRAFQAADAVAVLAGELGVRPGRGWTHLADTNLYVFLIRDLPRGP